MDTMLLDNTFWDLVVDANGNWAVASAPYAIAQDVASAIKTFQLQPLGSGEVWYNGLLGIPYFAKILGYNPPVSVFQTYMVNAALTVPNVVPMPAPVCTITGFTDRGVTGQVTFTDDAGNTQTVTLQ